MDKDSWADKVANHFGDAEFTTDEALDVISWKGAMAFSINKMSGKLRQNKRFIATGKRDVFYGSFKKQVTVWKVIT